MLNMLINKNQAKPNFEPKELDVLLSKIYQIYDVDDIEPNRRNYLSETVEKYGYLPYPQFKVLQELTPAETIFCLIKKLELAKTFINSKFIDFKNTSALKRNNIKNSNWIKAEGHNIKLISLSVTEMFQISPEVL